MPEGGYWARRQISRRGMLRGAGVGLAGLAGAALIGCGGDDDGGDGDGGGGDSSAATGTGGDGGGAAGSGIPANVTRAPGFDPSLGLVPINQKDMVPGGTFRATFLPSTVRTRMREPRVACARLTGTVDVTSSPSR